MLKIIIDQCVQIIPRCRSSDLFTHINYCNSTSSSYITKSCREVTQGLDAPRVAGSFPNLPSKVGKFGKLPATLGASNPGLTEPASMFGFYPIHRAIHMVALCDIFVDVLSTFSQPKKSMGS
jgi:hypothetical protein